MKALFNLGNKAIIMFLAGTIGVILGGPIAILIVSSFAPEVVGGRGFDAAWRALSTVAGSLIGGGANQTAMLEIFHYNQAKFGSMVLVDIIVANIWMAILLYGIGNKEKIVNWLNADNTAIESLKIKVTQYTESISRIPTVKDYMILLGIVFGAVGFSHWSSTKIPEVLVNTFPSLANVNRGDDAAPYTRYELRAKFMDLTQRIWPAEHAACLLETTLALGQTCASLADWAALLRRPPAA